MGTRWEDAPRTLTLAPDELHIWRAALDQDAGALERLGAALSPDERGRAARFVFPRDRARFVAARGLLREILGAYLGALPHELRFTYNAYGKPALAGPPGDWRLSFNLAHSGGLVLYALAQDRRVGVDVEQVRQAFDYAAMLPGIFSAREQVALMTMAAGKRLPAFFSTWASKEAVLKARGEGLALAPDQVEAGLLPETLHWSVDPGGQAWRVYCIDAGPGYAAAAAVESRELALRLYVCR